MDESYLNLIHLDPTLNRISELVALVILFPISISDSNDHCVVAYSHMLSCFLPDQRIP
jgi:hypothetical protein